MTHSIARKSSSCYSFAAKAGNSASFQSSVCPVVNRPRRTTSTADANWVAG